MALSSSEKEKTFCLKTCYLTAEEREKCMQPFGKHSRKKKKRKEGKRVGITFKYTSAEVQ